MGSTIWDARWSDVRRARHQRARKSFGRAQTASGALHAFIDRYGGRRDLGTPGRRQSTAWAVHYGSVTGQAHTSTGEEHAFFAPRGPARDDGSRHARRQLERRLRRRQLRRRRRVADDGEDAAAGIPLLERRDVGAADKPGRRQRGDGQRRRPRGRLRVHRRQRVVQGVLDRERDCRGPRLARRKQRGQQPELLRPDGRRLASQQWDASTRSSTRTA